jgi:hypothetical protein
MDKKAIYTLDLMIWILRICFVLIVIFVVSLLIRKHIFAKVDVSSTDSLLVTDRLLRSEHIFYTNPVTNKLDTSIIDWGKFISPSTEQELLDSIYYGDKNRHAGAKLTVDFGYFFPGPKQDIYYNKKFYDELLVQKNAWFGGSVGSIITSIPVYVFKDGKFEEAILTVEVLEYA